MGIDEYLLKNKRGVITLYVVFMVVLLGIITEGLIIIVFLFAAIGAGLIVSVQFVGDMVEECLER